MAAEPKIIADYPACTAPIATDLILAWGNSAANTLSIEISVLAAANQDTIVSSIVVSNTDTPADSDAGTHTGKSIWFDDDYIYCVQANGYIKRAALSTF